MRMAVLATRAAGMTLDGRRRRRVRAAPCRGERTARTCNSAKGVQGTDMRFAGKLVRDGRWWLAEIPMLDALTQGRTRREALEMVKDCLETAVNRGDFQATVHEKGRAEFEVSGS